MAEEIKKVLSVETGKSPESLKELKNQIKSLKDELVKLDEGSEEYAKTLALVADKSFQLREINEAVRYSAGDLGEVLTQTTRTMASLASGFGAVKGAMALFGDGAGVLDETMVKLQATIAFVQGLQGLEGLGKEMGRLKLAFTGLISPIKASIASLSAFKVALLSTGVGALVVALGALVANWDKLSKIMNPAKGSFDKVNEAIEVQNEEMQKEIEIMAALGKTVKEQLTYELSVLEEQLKKLQEVQRQHQGENWIAKWLFGGDKELQDTKAKIDETQKQIANVNHKITIEKIKDRQAEKVRIEKEKEDNIKLAQAKYEAERKAAQAIADAAENDARTELERLDFKYQKEKAQLEKFGIDTTTLTANYEKKRLEIIESVNTDIVESVEDVAEQQLKSMNEYLDGILKKGEQVSLEISTKLDTSTLQGEIAAVKGSSAAGLEQLMGGVFENMGMNLQTAKGTFPNMFEIMFGGAESQVQAIEQQYQTEFENLQAVYEPILQSLEEEYYNLQSILDNPNTSPEVRAEAEERMTENMNQMTQERMAMSQAELKIEKNKAKEIENLNKAKQMSFKVMGAGVASVFQSMSTIMGEETEAGKGFAAASATIQAFLAANEAYSALAGIPYVGPALGAAAAAAALVSGIANVKKILSTSADGSNVSSSSSGGGNGSLVVAPQQNLLTSPDITLTRNVLTDSEEEQVGKSQKVYVLESDIEDTVKKVNVAESSSTF